ncbi:hypothetical protein NE237_004209 [Protea cynaroides]|uniref:Uncharacterized protein n=1 Tax=Protea cynaroides TaxID=273540 RepID=A0A9Q0QT55_9MAGN|nr:hypothetical protein NE237_004209 [Protea cynaroides]
MISCTLRSAQHLACDGISASPDFKRRRITSSHKRGQEREPSGLEVLATTAVLGGSGGPQAQANMHMQCVHDCEASFQNPHDAQEETAVRHEAEIVQRSPKSGAPRMK